MMIICPYCGNEATVPNGAYNRAKRQGKPIYCNRICAGLGRRKNKTKAQKIEEKRLYDEQYRIKNFNLLKVKKSAYFHETYNPEKARIERKAKAHLHAEYCRQPEYREWKSNYDRDRRAKAFGPFADAYLVLLDLDKEVASRMSRYEIYQANGTLNKKLQRKREYENLISG